MGALVGSLNERFADIQWPRNADGSLALSQDFQREMRMRRELKVSVSRIVTAVGAALWSLLNRGPSRGSETATWKLRNRVRCFTSSLAEHCSSPAGS